MGAWIEIEKRLLILINRFAVAPLVGAWIEILMDPGYVISLGVAPLVGAWIEIFS